MAVESGYIAILRLGHSYISSQGVAKGEIKIGTRLVCSCSAGWYYVGPWRNRRNAVARRFKGPYKRILRRKVPMHVTFAIPDHSLESC